MNVAIVGLGLIGGSIAKSLKGFSDGKTVGIDIDSNVLNMALTDGTIDEGYTDAKAVLAEIDLLILCLYPKANVEFLRDNVNYLKHGIVITDVSGVKDYVMGEVEKFLPPYADFVGGHPMAGREIGGYASSLDTLFCGASYLIVPTEKNKEESIRLVERMARHIGCTRVVRTTREEHDMVIAYTSQLMHVVAVALCNNPILEISENFSAGSLKDCTRVALINEKLWGELFVENSEALEKRISEMQDSLEEIKIALKNKDVCELENIMKNAKERKVKWLME
ncbi:MAG: prephenate dehydrogenase [Clostridia bacterium]|nr:prephenate dehydrogenase [Clostridia bacterium]